MKIRLEVDRVDRVDRVEQKRPVDIFHEALDYLWNGLDLEEKGLEASEKRRLQKEDEKWTDISYMV